MASIIFGYLGKFIAGFWGEGASNITWSSYVGPNNFFPLVWGNASRRLGVLTGKGGTK